MKFKSVFMKNILITIVFFLSIFNTTAQSCCATASVDFSSLANDPAFVSTHAEPLPFHYIPVHGGQSITFPTADGKTANGFIIKAHGDSKKYLLVYQEWWGLNDYIKRQAESFYHSLGDVNVIAIDLYDGKIATTREDASKYMQENVEARSNEIIKGALKYIGKDAQVTSVGWCFGGGWSLKSAILSGKQAKGCVMYYGMPVDKVKELKKLNCSVLGLFATEQWINKEMIEKFDKNMKKAKKTLTYKIYEAEHAFANPSNPKFNNEATNDAYMKAVEYLKGCY
jgi:carboxymethylenebutenolidase